LLNDIQVGCAGALISLLQRRRAAVHLLGHGSTRSILPISVLEMSSLRETMFVNSDTLHSLQVIDDESHPNSHNRGPKRVSNGSKEGLSVYGLFQHLTRTFQGRHLLRQYFLRPSVNIDIINERLDTVATLLRPENEAVMAELSKYMKSIGNMNITMARLKKGSSGASVGKGGISKSLWSGIRNVKAL
jgi:DNA mismatch repair protein MSH5